MDGGLCSFQDLGEIERTVEEMVLIHLAVGTDFGAYFWTIEYFAVVESFGFPVVDGCAHFEFVDTADHFWDRTEAKLRHNLAEFFGDVVHEVNNCVSATCKALA